ncbi:terminase small subunit [Alkalicoccobacillus gibsonii]|uniref:terminase small subunit n=1 Tax=Alkalicoccobacillus gibsonii TaxID=79881 RepID=UPI001932D754|nr:terminase small subunit [Alkalicoccobacillus gibsonii]MBM0064941.1 terminase small subunit [Alkalicoccobacillus gibsonii]
MKELNVKQELFVNEYLQCFNATRAAVAAGYSEKTARSQGQRLLTNVDVKKKIDHEMARLRERMAEDANRAYAMLWEQLRDVEELLHRDQEAAAELDRLNKKMTHIEVFPQEYRNPIQSMKSFTAEMQEWFPYRLKQHNWLKAQELRSHLLQDILDRAGYKATDHVEIKGSVTTHSYDFSGLSDEELAKALKSYEG